MIVVTQDYVARTVGIVNLLYGGVGVLFSILLLMFVLGQLIVGRENLVLGELFVRHENRVVMTDGLFFPYSFKFLLVAIGFITTLPALVVGYGLLGSKLWAKSCRYISSVFALLNFPFGTAVAVYTIWISLVDDGESLASIRYGTTRSQ